jgi:hypothetical protein
LDTSGNPSEEKLLHSAREAVISPCGSPCGYNVSSNTVGRHVPRLLLGERLGKLEQLGVVVVVVVVMCVFNRQVPVHVKLGWIKGPRKGTFGIVPMLVLTQ